MFPLHQPLLILLALAFFNTHAAAWTWRAPSGPTGGNTIFGAVYSPQLDTVIAVDMGGSVLRKTGGSPWAATRVQGLVGFESAHWTGRHFIISGEDADDDWHGISSDGVNWTPITKLDDNGLHGFASSPTTTVALDGHSVWVSTDSERTAWAEKKLPLVRNSYGSPGYFDYIAYGNGIFLAADYEGSFVTSVDGSNWVSSPAKYDGSVNEMFFGNGLFVAAGYGQNAEGNYVYEIRTSADGKQWNLASLPRDLEFREILPIASGFIIAGYDSDYWDVSFYTTTDFVAWQRVEPTGANLSDWGWIQCTAPDKNGETYFFGSGGRIGQFSSTGNLQMVVDPGGPGGEPCGGSSRFFRYLAAVGSTLFGSDDYAVGSYYLGPGGRWVEVTNGLDHPSKPSPESFHQLSDGVVAVTTWPSSSIYAYRNNSWELLGPAPRIDSHWSIVSVARSPQGRAVVLARSGWQETPGNEDQRDYKFYFSDDWQQWQTSAFSHRGLYYGGPVWSGAEDVVQHDGRRFLAVLEPGLIFQSGDGSSWTPLPRIPDDTVAFRKQYFGSKSSVPLANEPRSFASSGDILVAGSTKLERSASGSGTIMHNAIDCFYVYSFDRGTWQTVIPPGYREESRHPPILRWNGKVFLAAIRDGTCLSADYEGGYIYTSPNGYDWTKREFPVGGNLLDVLWTGTEFAAVTFGSSVLTHPTGLTQPIAASGPPAQADQISFAKIPPKVFGAAPFALKATAKSGRPVAFSSSNTEVASVEDVVVTAKAAGTTSITASVSGDTSVVPVTQQLVVSALQQKFSIQFKPTQRRNVPFEIIVKGNSDKQVEFASEPAGAITVQAANGRYTATAAATGKLKLIATQPGDNNRLAAKPVSKTLRVGP